MITPRGWWLLFIVGILLGIAVWNRTAMLGLVCLTVLGWFLGSLFLFAVRVRYLHGRLAIVRQLLDEQGAVASLWAERTYCVRVEVVNEGWVPSPHLWVTDRLAYGARSVAGELHAEGSVMGGQPLEINYYLYCPAPGRLRFEGVQVQCADLQGLFYHTFFLREVSYYRVLPAFADIKGHAPAVKRHNVLPTAGHHRYKRPGSGSELLDLRDYIPGDPPKTIAWKVSARRDRLITKVFESEVPIRCTFFVDVSHSVRVGPQGQNALTRLAEVTAALAQASAGQRDLPGLCLFDQDQVHTYLRPARHGRHVIQILNVLADAAALSPSAKGVDPETLLPLGYGLAEEVYPELMRPEINHFPWWLPPIAPPVPFRKRRLPFWFQTLLAFLGLAAFFWVVLFLVAITGRGSPVDLLPLLVLLVVAGVLLLVLRAAAHSLGSMFPWRARLYRWRKKLSALLSVRYGLAPQGLGELLEDDDAFMRHLQRFLAEHQVPCALPLYSPEGKYLHAVPAKVEVLARALLSAVARGKDNELFVLLADLVETEPLEPLVRAVKVAVARHHQVILLCPWPPGVPLPAREEAEPRPLDLSKLHTVQGLLQVLQDQTTARLHRAYHRLRRTFGRIGVTVHCAANDDSIRLILDRLQRMRSQLRGVR